MKKYTYNRLFLLSLFVLVAFGCTDDDDKGDLKQSEKHYNLTKAASEDDAMFPTYSPGKNGEINKEIIERERDLKEKLLEMAPICD
ncbi:hypothetical protein [Dyadobacter sp. CY326]|uniref:hypothetical protein n=1 Tax=Dyadobacter sp. CY326 TaxID=2907300 RepID=UPI001F390C11|nr:hypothetical protein [Dyadobacter sp. CY326]MCE7066466.1 hypothetical protein [Dyadobacter sp. CY326]